MSFQTPKPSFISLLRASAQKISSPRPAATAGTASSVTDGTRWTLAMEKPQSGRLRYNVCRLAFGLAISLSSQLAWAQDDDYLEPAPARSTVANSIGKMRTALIPRSNHSNHSHTTTTPKHTHSHTNSGDQEVAPAAHGSLLQQVRTFTDSIFGESSTSTSAEHMGAEGHNHATTTHRTHSRNPNYQTKPGSLIGNSSHTRSTRSSAPATETPRATTASRAPTRSVEPFSQSRATSPSDRRASAPADRSAVDAMDPPSVPIKSVAEATQAARRSIPTSDAPPKPKIDTAPAAKEVGAPPPQVVSTQKSSRRTTVESTETSSRTSSNKSNADLSVGATRTESTRGELIAIGGNSTSKKDDADRALQSHADFDFDPPSIPRKAPPSETNVAALPSAVTSNPHRSNIELESSRPAAAPRGMELDVPTTKQTSTKGLRADTVIADLDMGIPQTKLKLHGPSAIKVGETGAFQVVAMNEGGETLSGLLVRVGVPAGARAHDLVADGGAVQTEREGTTENIIWQIDNIGAYQSKVLNLALDATKPEHFSLDVEWTVMPQSGRMPIQVHQPQLQMALEGASEVIFGKPEMYRLRIRNPGNVDIKDTQISLSAGPYGNNETTIGDIPAGGERIVEVELTFQQPGRITIDAVAKSKSTGLTSNAKVEVTVNQAALTLEWNAPAEQFQGSICAYTLAVTNEGSFAANNIECTIVLPEGAHAVGVAGNVKAKGQELKWSIPSLAAGAVEKLNFEVQLNREGNAAIRASLVGSAGAKASSEAITRVESISDLKLTVTDPIAPAPVGQPVTYELVVTNRGTKPARAVRVLAQFSNGIEPVNASGQSHRLVPGQVLFDPIAAVGPGEKVTLKVIAEANEAGMHRFRAEVQCEDGEVQLVQEESTRYLATARSDRSPTVLR